MSQNDTKTTEPTNSAPSTTQAPSSLPTPTPVPTTSSPAPVSQGNQGIMGLLALVIVLLIGFLIVLVLKNNSGPNIGQDLSSIREQNQSLQAELEAERKARGLPAFDSAGVTNIAERMSKDAGLLVATVEELETALAKKEESASGAAQSLIASQQLNSNLSIQVRNLENQLAQLKINAQDAPQLRSQLTQLAADLEMERGKLLELSRRPTSQTLADVKKAFQDELAKNLTLQDQINKLTSQLEQSKSQVSKVNPATLELLKTELEQLRPENKDLKRELQRLRAELDSSRLYVQSSDNLSPKAAALYAGLQQLEGLTRDELEAAYERIGQTLNAQIVHQIKFAEGESHVTPVDVDKITARLTSAEPNSFFLVVGYASKSGDADSNKTLSAQRATRSASVVNTLKVENQDVKAVYLGQTNRFSNDQLSENQICEIWKLN